MSSLRPRKRLRVVHDSSDDEIESPVGAKDSSQRLQIAPSKQKRLGFPSTPQLELTTSYSGGSTFGSQSFSSSNPSTRLSTSSRARASSSKRARGISRALHSPSKASSIPSTRTTPTSSPEKRKIGSARSHASDASPAQSSKSLKAFFQPSTEEERWDTSRREREREKERDKEKLMLEKIENEILDDIIEDDDSFDELWSQARKRLQSNRIGGIGAANVHIPLDRRKSRVPLPNEFSSRTAKTTQSQTQAKPIKRLLLPPDVKNADNRLDKPPSVDSSVLSSGSVATQSVLKPWADQFSPSNLSELAVHKKKVSDVQQWLVEVFTGRSNRRVLVLKGPAGSGKTTVVSLLSKVLGYDIIEWKHSGGSEYTSRGEGPTDSSFDEFLGRSDKFGSLELDGQANKDQSTSTISKPRIILVEEFPTSLSPGSPGLIAFRSAIQRYIASTTQTHQMGRLRVRPVAERSPPIVIIVSEALLGASISVADNFTVHRLLGPELSNHPAVNIIEFNPIAPTYIMKALDLVLKKEAAISRRKRIPGPAVLKSFTEMGDIRSAITSLEFLCLRGDERADWSGRLGRRSKSDKSPASLTQMESDSLAMVSQRESTLGIFHAVGKVVYNKRDGMTPSNPTATEHGSSALHIPPHLQKYNRPASQVSLDDLMNETGTDIQTFLAALHENYMFSCNGDSFAECFDNCASLLSDADILGTGNRWNSKSNREGVGTGRLTIHGSGTSVDVMRQNEISFQVATRGLLFSLPYPVNRRGPDAFKMFYPTSLRLWRQTEELDGLLALWMRRLADANIGMNDSTAARPQVEGVASWRRNRASPLTNGKPAIRCMFSREEVLLECLPYMRLISKDIPQRQEIERLVCFRGTIRRSQEELDEDGLDNAGSNSVPSITASIKKRTWPNRLPPISSSPGFTAVADRVNKLVLSDDDIEDD
ncbi:Cell cycle checkpoint protein rad17 [Myotisia sp. PD_48]|nr:Cell cycle checkpoint protein rad17 [Myotisia sp. PD_48]